MSNLLWPGDHRAGEHMTDEALLGSMIAVECAWLDALAATGLAPADCAEAELWNLVAHNDCESIAVTAESGGNPVIPLVKLLRQRANPGIAPWIHRGLTSQDVMDTSLMLAVRAVADDLTTELRQQISTLSDLATEHRSTPMVARTLTQHAAPTTFGVKVAGWLNGIVDAIRAGGGADHTDPNRRRRRHLGRHDGAGGIAHRYDRRGRRHTAARAKRRDHIGLA